MLDERGELMEGRRTVPRLRRVVEADQAHPPYAVLDHAGAKLEPVTEFLRDLALGDSSPLICRSYGYAVAFHYAAGDEDGVDQAAGSALTMVVAGSVTGKTARSSARSRMMSASLPGVRLRGRAR